MKPIDSVHLQKFYGILTELNAIFPLNMENIRFVIEIKGKKSFPDNEKIAIALAVTDNIRDQCKPYIPIIAITSAPHHLSDHVGILELKIMDSRKNSADGLSFIAWLSIFPSGRMIFGMDGVNLDSNGKNIAINEDVARRDHKFFAENTLVRNLRVTMLQVFRSKETIAIDAKAQLFRIFSEQIPQNN